MINTFKNKMRYVCNECKKSFIQWKNKPYPYSYKFCSRKCCASYQSRLYTKWNKIITKEMFEDLYLKNKMSLSDLSKKFVCSIATISKLRKEYDIKKRGFNEAVKIGIHKNIEKFREASRGSKNPMFGKISYPKARFIPNLGHSVRSKWEEIIAFKLKDFNIPYKYEGITFKINKNNTYTPDFIIKDIAVEVKGMLFDKNREKLISFKKECPYKLWVITGDRNRFDFSFSDKIFRVFNDRKNILNKKEMENFINEIRKNI